MDMFKKLGAWAILGVIVSGLFTFVPPIYNAASTVFALGSKYNSLVTEAGVTHQTLVSQQAQISVGRNEIREFRSVWCMDRLSSSGRVNSVVLRACAEWIKAP